MSIVYLASPYSHSDPAVWHSRFVAACRCAGLLLAKGVHAFSPIAHSHPIVEHCPVPLGGNWGFWREYDTVILKACSEAYVLTIPGWAESTGVQAEIALARDLGLPIRYVDEQGEVI